MVSRGPNQTVRVGSAREGERARGVSRPPMRAYLMDAGQIQKVCPITFDDQGHPNDLTWTPPTLTRIDRIMFVYEGRSFIHYLNPQILEKGQQLHLALRHMSLLSRFGVDYLKKGRGA